MPGDLTRALLNRPTAALLALCDERSFSRWIAVPTTQAAGRDLRVFEYSWHGHVHDRPGTDPARWVDRACLGPRGANRLNRMACADQGRPDSLKAMAAAFCMGSQVPGTLFAESRELFRPVRNSRAGTSPKPLAATTVRHRIVKKYAKMRSSDSAIPTWVWNPWIWS
jgi:hypothetical protein